MQMTSTFFVAAMGIPNAWLCLKVAAPYLVAYGLWWCISRMDQLLNKLFPHWEWEKRMGWLNIRLERQTDTILRWMGYGLFAALAAALYGIVCGVQALQAISNWGEPEVFGEIAMRVLTLVICLGFWLVYLGGVLVPKLRNQYEADELEKFRAQQDAEGRDYIRPSRRTSSMAKPGRQAPLLPNRMRRGR